jgi:hypothetical protein
LYEDRKEKAIKVMEKKDLKLAQSTMVTCPLSHVLVVGDGNFTKAGRVKRKEEKFTGISKDCH